MKSALTLLAATTVLALATPAIAADAAVKTESTVDYTKNGGYDKNVKTEQHTKAGKVSSEAESKLSVDDNGDTTKTTTTEDVKDPKGLMNKHTVRTKVKEKTRDGKTTVEKTKDVDGHTVVDSKTEATY